MSFQSCYNSVIARSPQQLTLNEQVIDLKPAGHLKNRWEQLYHSSQFPLEFRRLKQKATFRSEWDSLHLTSPIPLRLRELIQRINCQIKANGSIDERAYLAGFKVLAEQLQSEFSIDRPIHNDIFNVSDFILIKSQLEHQDQSLLQIWEKIAFKIPEEKKPIFDSALSPMEKAEKIRKWIASPSMKPILNTISELDLSYCNLKTLPPEIQFLSALKELHLKGNELDVLPLQILSLKDLEYLDLSYNYFIEIPSAIAKIPSLKQLILSNNRISEVQKELGGLDNLELLDLSDNPILFIDKLVKESDNLAISHNNVVVQHAIESHQICSSPIGKLYQGILKRVKKEKIYELLSCLDRKTRNDIKQRLEIQAKHSANKDPLTCLGLILRSLLLEQWEELPASQKKCGLQLLQEMTGSDFDAADEYATHRLLTMNIPQLADILSMVSKVDIEKFKQMSTEEKGNALEMLCFSQQILLLRESLDSSVDIPEQYVDLTTSSIMIDPVKDHCGGKEGGHRFEKHSILRYASEEVISADKVDQTSHEIPATCPFSRQPLGVDRTIIYKNDELNSESWTYTWFFHLFDLSKKEEEGLIIDSDFQREILAWLKTQHGIDPPTMS